MIKIGLNLILLIVSIVLISACTNTSRIEEPGDGPPLVPVNIENISDPIPIEEPKSLRGNPKSYVVFDQRYDVLTQSQNYIERGIASWYGRKFHGRKTSNGETYDMLAMTAAHKTLPLPTYVQVTNLENNRSAVVRVNDRGPFHENRIIDLSYAAAVKLGINTRGTGFVEIRALTDPASYENTQLVKKVLATHHIYLQIGAFSDLNNALRLKTRIKRSALPAAQISAGVYLENPIYRVLIGPIASVDKADKLSKRLSDLGFHNSRYLLREELNSARMVR